MTSQVSIVWGCGSVSNRVLRRVALILTIGLVLVGFVHVASAQATTYDCMSGTSVTGSFTVVDDVVTSNSSCTGTAVIPSGVTSIGWNAFLDSSSLTSVTIPSSVTSIGIGAFRKAPGLTSITFLEPSNLISIDAAAFLDSSSLKSITFPSSLTNIGGMAFQNTNLRSITIPSSVTSIGDQAFYGLSSLSSVTFSTPSSLTNIDYSAFSGASSLTSVTLPASLISIGGDAFHGASSLSSITFSTPSSLTTIGGGAFYGASSLKSVTIPSSVTSIGGSAFVNASSLTNITVASSNTNYADRGGVLYNKDSTTLVAYPVGNSRFAYTIPITVTSIGNRAFSSASSLTSITIPSGVTSIGDEAFQGASSLTSITIPSGVTSIGYSAFEGTSSLSSIRFLGDAPTIDHDERLFWPVSGTVYRFASAHDWPVITDPFEGLSQAYLLLPPATLVATAGDASVTISVTSPPSPGPPPSSYTISAVSDATKTCVINGPTGSCTIGGLTNGTPYTFTAIAYTTTPVATSIVSDPSNQVTPTALNPPETPTRIRWSQGSRIVKQPITAQFAAAAGTTYAITATSNTARSFQTRATRTARGTCKVTTNTKTKKRAAKCTIRLKKAGTWLVAITPIKSGVAGTPATKTIKIRAATKKTRMFLARHTL